MNTLHQSMRGKHRKQALHDHGDHPHDHQHGGHGHAQSGAGVGMMRLLGILHRLSPNDEWMSNYRTKRLVPASNKVIIATILVLLAGVVLYYILPTSLGGVGLAVIVAAAAHLAVLVIGGLGFTLFIRQQRRAIRQQVLNSIPWRGDERVLDVGCGTGMLLNGCAGKLITGKATGIDLWQESVAGSTDVLMANARAEGVADKIELRNMDARHMAFEDASFDVVVSSAALHHIAANREECEQAVSEMIRVLAPGGTLTLADIGPMMEIAESVIEHAGLEFVARRQTRFFRYATARKAS